MEWVTDFTNLVIPTRIWLSCRCVYSQPGRTAGMATIFRLESLSTMAKSTLGYGQVLVVHCGSPPEPRAFLAALPAAKAILVVLSVAEAVCEPLSAAKDVATTLPVGKAVLSTLTAAQAISIIPLTTVQAVLATLTPACDPNFYSSRFQLYSTIIGKSAHRKSGP